MRLLGFIRKLTKSCWTLYAHPFSSKEPPKNYKGQQLFQRIHAFILY